MSTATERILARALKDGHVTRDTATEAAAEGEPPATYRTVASRNLRTLTEDGWLVHTDHGTWEPTRKARSEPFVSRSKRSGRAKSAREYQRRKAKASAAKESTVDRVRRIMGMQARAAEMGLEVPAELVESLRLARAVHAAEDWVVALPALFPSLCTVPFAPHHIEMLEWASQITTDTIPRPYTAFWSRGHGKSALAEMIAVMLGHRRARKYVLYVCGKQAKADDHLESIFDLLESDELAVVDPEMSERKLGKYGTSRGWRHNRITTRAGFMVDAVGLDVDIRGARRGKDRVDMIIFDDVDGLEDSVATIEKKIRRITQDLIPTQGMEGVAIMFVQNIIHHQSIAASLAELESAPKVDFLARRVVSGPIPALENLEWREEYDEEVDRNRFVISGDPTWPEGYDLAQCQAMVDDEGLVAFLAECQHKRGSLKGGMFDHINFATRRKTRAELPVLRDNGTWTGTCVTWCDPAVTATDRSDSCAVVTGGLGPDRKIWWLESWEQVASTEDAMIRALEAAMRWGSQVLGFETDQGGDTWEVVFRKVLRDQLEDPDSFVYLRHYGDGVSTPRYAERKAGATEGNLSKRGRLAQLAARYDTDDFRHFDEGCVVLEAGLSRYPKYKPFDVADACWHGWRWLAEHGGERSGSFRVRSPSRRQT